MSICARKGYIREEIKRAGISPRLSDQAARSSWLLTNTFLQTQITLLHEVVQLTPLTSLIFFLFKLSEAGRALSTIKEGRQSLWDDRMMALLQSVHYSAQRSEPLRRNPADVCAVTPQPSKVRHGKTKLFIRLETI